MEARDQKLYGAGELHRFNRDVEDALSRMQEKYASIPEELGRDLKTVQSYIKKHEVFENDLVALEAQVTKFTLVLCPSHHRHHLSLFVACTTMNALTALHPGIPGYHENLDRYILSHINSFRQLKFPMIEIHESVESL